MPENERRGAIISLLRVRDEGLPEPRVRATVSSGFVNEARSRTCPDCLANGQVMNGCETCAGFGVITGGRLARLAVTDELPDDLIRRDPYANNDTVGWNPTRHDQTHARDRQIEILDQQLHRPANTAEEIEEANRHPYVWERERKAMYRRYDLAALDRALDALRIRDDGAYHALHLVYVYDWLEPSATVEEACERGLAFLEQALPDPLRAPGVPAHPADARQSRRRAA